MLLLINLIIWLGIFLWACKRFPKFGATFSRFIPTRPDSPERLAKDAKREAMYKKYDEELERGE